MSRPTPQTPRSTYRLQLHAGFTFDDAIAITEYLARFGVSHVYSSPILKAVRGSMHGYDVIDHNELNPELRPASFDRWIQALHAHRLGYLLDIVPNHMGVDTNENRWWNELLEHGASGPRGRFFDVDWRGSHRASMKDRLLLPVLGQPYGAALEAGEIKLVREGDRVLVGYFDKRFPVAPGTAPRDVDAINRDPAALDAVLQKQHYRLCSWRSAADEINYRRFFDINSLAAVAMERREVFDQAHALVFRLIDEGKVDGLRLDHPDGLYDPKQYFDRLQEARPEPLYVVAEKILGMDEPLETTWSIDGTSGYDFLVQANALFVDTQNAQALSDIYDDFTAETHDFETICYLAKLQILDQAMASELHVLTQELDRIAQQDRRTSDYTFAQLRAAIRETVARFSVYRTYITDEGVSQRDAELIGQAIDRAARSARQTDAGVFEFLKRTMLSERHFAGKFQQLTSPVTAKGIEDTAFYRYHRLISLNEVGGEPARFGIEPDALHAWFAERQTHWPGSLSTLSTHDTKRSEDVRARINVLSEMPEVWRDHVTRFRRLSDEAGVSIDANDEYLLYQTLIGAWPIDRERLSAYMTKALREAKQRSTWTSPDVDYETRVGDLIDWLLDPARNAAFMEAFVPLQERVARVGWINSLAQTTLKCWAPGVPDTYQGTELLDLSLVDPDNRRPVDYEARIAALRSIDEAPTADPRRHKLLILSRSLRYRRDHADLALRGEYVPLTVRGERSRHVFAFARVCGSEFAIVVIPRLVSRIESAEDWSDTRVEIHDALRKCQTHELFAGRATRLSDELLLSVMWADFPVGVWVNSESGQT